MVMAAKQERQCISRWHHFSANFSRAMLGVPHRAEVNIVDVVHLPSVVVQSRLPLANSCAWWENSPIDRAGFCVIIGLKRGSYIPVSSFKVCVTSSGGTEGREEGFLRHTPPFSIP